MPLDGGRCWRGAAAPARGCGASVIMHTLHVVEEIPATRKTIPGERAIALGKVADVWFVTMTVHSMGFAFMSEETCRGRELRFGAGCYLASVWL